MSEPRSRYWFPAKKYGWGWGPPTRWQGWVFLLVWLAVNIAGAVRLHPLLPTRPGLYVAWIVLMLAIMVAVGYAKGEPPRWRWGDRDKP
ncbi:MAG TPA: hypothetical protein VHL80_00545 [Polyangia bacterium]|nr:hypothetical protein [Polyangia bacterium]